MKITICKSLVGISLLFSLASCATVINGTKQKIPIATSPAGATVTVDGYMMGYSPTIVEVARKRDHVVTLEKEGYETENIRLRHVISGAVAGNIIAGGFIGWGVDACSGGQYRMSPETVDVYMQPAGWACSYEGYPNQ